MEETLLTTLPGPDDEHLGERAVVGCASSPG